MLMTFLTSDTEKCPIKVAQRPVNFNKYLKSILIGIMNLSISFIGKGEQKYKYPWEV